jgi:lysophospholipase
VTSKKLHKPLHWRFEYFESASGSKIRYGYSKPNGKSKGTVLVTGGYGRHIEYYYEKINNWLDRGFTVYAMDWDGQGGSSRENPNRRDRPSSKDFEHHADIFHEFVQNIARPDRTKPAFLSSHSKGGNVMLRYIHKYEKRPDYPFSGAILAAPMIDINTRFLRKQTFRRLVNAFRRAGIEDVPLSGPTKLLKDFASAVRRQEEHKTSDPLRQKFNEHYQKMSSPHQVGSPTMSWLTRAMESIDVVKTKEFLENIHTPVLILTPHKDNLVCIDSQKWAAQTLKNGKQIPFQTAQHGLWYENDAVQKKVWQEIDNFTAPLIQHHIPTPFWLIAINKKITFKRDNRP